MCGMTIFFQKMINSLLSDETFVVLSQQDLYLVTGPRTTRCCTMCTEQVSITMASMTKSIMIKGGRLLQKKVENISGSWRIGSHKANKTLGAYRKGSIPFSCNNAAF